MKFNLSVIMPFIIGLTLSICLGMTVWYAFYFVFSWIGLCISIGNLISTNIKNKELGRKIAILSILPIFIVFFGFMQRENMQLEETVFYGAYFLTAGIFTRVLIHYAIAKVFGPLIWGRGFCGWACWTAAVLDWLPIKENRKIPKGLTYLRIPVLVLSIAVPFLLILMGYPYITKHINGDSSGLIQTLKWEQFLWFLAGNGLYYLSGIILAFVFRKKRAFCKVLCPVSLIMKATAGLAILKVSPTGKPCTHCGKCNSTCPMDVDVQGFISRGEKVKSTECINCMQCSRTCPAGAIG
jgi:ferredoxin-type protein NapH